MKHMNPKEKRAKISDLAGSWNVSDEELKEINSSISQAWEKWKTEKR